MAGDDQPTSMYDQGTSWQAPPGAQTSGAVAPDSAELPKPFGMFGQSSSSGEESAQPDPWADYLSFNQSRTWGHSDWKWQGSSWNGWRSWDDAKTLGTDPRGGYAWDRNWSWDATWASASTGSGGDVTPDGEEERRDGTGDGRPTTSTTGRAAMLAASTTLTPATTTRPSRESEGGDDHGRGPSERMVVPGFSGAIGDGESDDLGSTARSYLRQVAAWQKMTRISPSRQGLILYQHLSGKAWIEAERLDIDKLSGPSGAAYFVEWIRERYLDVQVTQVSRSLSEFFRKLKKRPGQSIRDYVGEFDRAQARLEECGCSLPNIALAWMFVDRMNLDEPSELNLLASVGNVYDLRRLQQAATIQDRALRKPWEGAQTAAKPWQRRQNHSAHMADSFDPDYEHRDEKNEENNQDDNPLAENMAEELFTTFMSHETAKQKCRDSQRGRGTDPQAMKEIAAAKLQQLKARSFCAGCKRRGHWHKDDVCPLNQGKSQRSNGDQGGDGGVQPATKTSYVCNVVHVAWNIEVDTCDGEFDAITDTACSKSVAGHAWLEEYIGRLAKIGEKPQLLFNDEHFRFGASRIFHSAHACIVTFKLGRAIVEVKVAIVQGDLPLLLSRPVLAELGMIMDVALNQADFRSVHLYHAELKMTESGHPALPLVPVQGPTEKAPADFWSNGEVMIHQTGAAYKVFATRAVEDSNAQTSEPGDPSGFSTRTTPTCQSTSTTSSTSTRPKLFYPKKIPPEIQNLLTGKTLNSESFMAWWKTTNVSNDFWIESYTVQSW